jgi:hypothetical protein
MISGTAGPTDALRAQRVLRFVAIFYAIGFLVHTADHFRRGLDVLTPEVLWAGSVSSAVAVAAIVLALLGHRLAPPVAVAAGFSQALGVAAVHLLPRWSALNDSLAAGGADGLSWAAVLIEIAGALAFGAAGAYALRRGTPRAIARLEAWRAGAHRG